MRMRMPVPSKGALTESRGLRAAISVRAGEGTSANRSDGDVSQAAVAVIGVILGLACVLFALCFVCGRRGPRGLMGPPGAPVSC